jgi:ubiquitin carboxyl-terminal hydrolase 10
LSSAPLVVGSSVEAFMEQKLKYRELKRQKKRELEVQHEVPTELTIESDIEHIESNEEPQEKLKSPATINWASVAQSAIKKQPPTPVTSPQQVHKQAQEKLVPVVSNVLEPLGIVVLRFMFDENFMNHSSNIKVPQIIPRGLVNTGNICFMSSIMQLLLYCEPFYKALNIISNKTRHSLDETKSIFDALVEFYHNFNIRLDEKHIERDYGDSFTPLELFKSISKNPRFQHLRWGQQEDAEEFFGYLLDGLHEEFTESVKQLSDDEIKKLNTTLSDDAKLTINKNLRKFHEDEFNSSEISGRNDEDEEDGWKEVGQKKTAKRTVEVKPSPIRKIFGGQFRSVLNIPKSKESQSITLDPFQQIQLDISDDDINTLEDAFTKISSIEEIPMKTSEGLEVIAKRQTFLDKFPDVLVIHLKRFSFGSNGRVEKLTKKVSYPHLFNIPMSCYSSSLKKTTPSELQYKLTGVVYHHGLSSNGGHYTVDVLRSEGKWIRIDDVSIVCLEPVEVLDNSEDAKTAYILMYQKV